MINIRDYILRKPDTRGGVWYRIDTLSISNIVLKWEKQLKNFLIALFLIGCSPIRESPLLPLFGA